jgi:hypothetical protein
VTFEQIFGAGGSNLVRTTSSTQGFFANNNVGGFANFIQTTTSLGAGTIGGLLTKANLPNNFVVANPQFVSTYLTGNFSNSTYHSGQVVVDRRLSGGLTLQGSYVFSKALGDEEGDSSTEQSSYYTVRNRSLDKRRLLFDRTHVFKVNGLYELPFGRGKTFFKNANGFLDRVVGGWQLSGIFNKYSGQPLTFTGQSTFNNFPVTRGFTPNIVGALPEGEVARLGQGVTYFANLTQITCTAMNILFSTSTLASRSSLPYDCVKAPTRGLKPRSQISVWIFSRSAQMCRSIFWPSSPPSPNCWIPFTARSKNTQAITFEWVKWRFGPLTSQMP